LLLFVYFYYYYFFFLSSRSFFVLLSPLLPVAPVPHLFFFPVGAELMLQLFDKKGIAHYEPYWCEINGHAFNLYIQKGDKLPCVRFDLKEMRMYPAARGLPGKEVDPKGRFLFSFIPFVLISKDVLFD
jgi:hypothetical protein